MHPLAAIGLVFLTGLAWMATVVTMLVSLAKSRRQAATEGRLSIGDAKAPTADAEAAGK